jgi:hypothetical protein
MKSIMGRVLKVWPFNRILALDSEIEEMMSKQKAERLDIDERLNKISAATLEGDWCSIITPKEL